MAASRAVFSTLAQEFVDQLLVEQVELTEVHRHTEMLRAAILERNAERLEAAAISMDHQRAHYAQISQRRLKLRARLAELLGVPIDRATLSRLLPLVDPPLKARLDALRRELRSKTRQIERTNRANLMIVRQLGDVLQTAFDQLTGKPTASRYAADGHLLVPEAVPLFQTDC